MGQWDNDPCDVMVCTSLDNSSQALRVCVSVAVVRAITRKILRALQSENNVGTVESKDTLLEFAKVRRKGLKKEQVRGMFRRTRMDFGM